MIHTYCFNYHHHIISSKLILNSSFNWPKIKKIAVFFILNAKYYKKNILLFYIIVNLSFSDVIITHNKEMYNYQILKFSIRSNKINNFFNNFINVYLPILDGNQNLIKKVAVNNIETFNCFLYRINYFNFPLVPESDFLCYSNEYISNLINNYQVRFDVYVKFINFTKNSLEFLFRLYKFPVIAIILKNRK